MIKVPGDAIGRECCHAYDKVWHDFGGDSYRSHNFPAEKWDNPRIYCWLLTHPSGVYLIWSAWTGKGVKKYPDIETAKIAVELQI